MAKRALPGLGLTGGYAVGEDGWGNEQNANLLKVSVLAQGGVINRVEAVPANPTQGDTYVLTAAPNAQTVAVYDNGAWVYFTPLEGWMVYDRTADLFIGFDGTQWKTVQTGGSASFPSLAGNKGKFLAVKTDETGVEWAVPATGSALPSLTGNKNKVLAVKTDETGTEWIAAASGGGLADAPSDGKNYVRKDAAWAALAALTLTKAPEGWTAFTPAASSEVGVLTAVNTSGLYMQIGSTVFYRIVVIVTTNGTGAGSIRASLPVNLPARPEAFTGSGRETNKTGKQLQTHVINTTTISIAAYDNTYPASDGTAMQVAGFYQTTAAAIPIVTDVSGQVAGGGGGGGAVVDPQPAIAARNWRVVITDTQNQGLIGFSEVQFVDKDGFTLAAGGTAIASSSYDSTRVAAKAFDGNLLQDDQVGFLLGDSVAGSYIGYKMPVASAVLTALIAPMTARGDPSNISTQSNVTVQVQYQLTDADAWTNIGAAVNLTGKLAPGVLYPIPLQARPATNAGPRLIQKAALRNDGNLTLGTAPTAGNLLVCMTVGWGGSISAYKPAGFKRVGVYYNGADNAVACWARVAQAGDPAAWAMSAADNQSAVMYEFSNASNVQPFMGGPLVNASGSNVWSMEYFLSPLGVNSIVLGALENDSAATFASAPVVGVTVDRADAAVTRAGYFMQFRSTLFPGRVEGTLSSGVYTNPVYGMFAVG